jgi:hypothetical protein
MLVILNEGIMGDRYYRTASPQAPREIPLRLKTAPVTMTSTYSAKTLPCFFFPYLGNWRRLARRGRINKGVQTCQDCSVLYLYFWD